MLIMIPVYFKMYGPTNFLYICDAALIITLLGLWFNSPLLISICAVGIIAAQSLWLIDFFGTLIGLPVLGLTEYMFRDTSLFLRGLSLFHGWLPILLIYLVYKMGYDPRAIFYWTGLFVILMIFSILLTPRPGEAIGLAPSNINFVWGLRDGSPQTFMPRGYWLALLIIGMPLLLFYPTHLILKKFF